MRALLTADKNQHFARSRMTDEQRRATPEVDFRPFIIADADTGHGGDAHVRNLIRRFVEVGVPGLPHRGPEAGRQEVRPPGRQGPGRQDEQIKRLNAARLQLDIMRVPGIIVARTDAEAATFLDNRTRRARPAVHPRRDEPRAAELPGRLPGDPEDAARARARRDPGAPALRGPRGRDAAAARLARAGRAAAARSSETPQSARDRRRRRPIEELLDAIDTRFLEAWQADAGLKTYGQAVADVIELRAGEGERFDMTLEEWLAFAGTRVVLRGPREGRRRWASGRLGSASCPRRPRATTRSRAASTTRSPSRWRPRRSPTCCGWKPRRPTSRTRGDSPRRSTPCIPDKMLAYNLSPSFNWDTTGMTDERDAAIPRGARQARLRLQLHHLRRPPDRRPRRRGVRDRAARRTGCCALARLQRKFRLLESPYRTPQTLVGGARLDAALMAASGRTAATKAMGKGSTQHQHLVQTEVPPKLLEDWLATWASHWDQPGHGSASSCARTRRVPSCWSSSASTASGETSRT